MNTEANYFLTNNAKLVCFVVTDQAVRIIETVRGRKVAEKALPRPDAREVYAKLRKAGFEKW